MKRRLLYTIGITAFTFAFISLLIYTIYCYAFYNSNVEEKLLEKYNFRKYDDIYDNLFNEANLSKEDFMKPITLMYDESELETIYKTYYINSSIYQNMSDFISKYYYGDNQIKREDIVYNKIGDTNLFKRAKILYESINVHSRSGEKSSLGTIKDLKIKTENNSEIKIDGNKVDCNNNICQIDYFFKGIHEIIYTSNGYTYYGLININDENEIDIANNESLISIEYNNSNAKIKKGMYYLADCNASTCPISRHSYIKVIDDNNIEFKDNTGNDYYKGTYKISNNYIKITLEEHIYLNYNNETNETTETKTKIFTQTEYKIEKETTLINHIYTFSYSNN